MALQGTQEPQECCGLFLWKETMSGEEKSVIDLSRWCEAGSFRSEEVSPMTCVGM